MPEEMLEERDCLLQEAIEHEAICPRMTAYYLNAALAVEERVAKLKHEQFVCWLNY